jgi:hypothetical protein
VGVRENKVERYLKKQVTAQGGVSRKWVSPNHDGVPDQIIISRGVVWFVEVKSVDGVLSSVQKREHKRLRNAGANVTTVYGDVGVDTFIEELKRGHT